MQTFGDEEFMRFYFRDFLPLRFNFLGTSKPQMELCVQHSACFDGRRALWIAVPVKYETGSSGEHIGGHLIGHER